MMIDNGDNRRRGGKIRMKRKKIKKKDGEGVARVETIKAVRIRW